ncbi:hypothetical protein ATO6_07905 [Oceanicola sp. 22II-s10i]|nr:hypothetical protein ATO6_07905 [Oceanicola sp. 22II-s10i]
MSAANVTPAGSAARARRAYRVAAALEPKTCSGPDSLVDLMSLHLSLPKLQVKLALSRPEAASGSEPASDEGEAPLVSSDWWILPSAMVGTTIWVLLMVSLFS